MAKNQSYIIPVQPELILLDADYPYEGKLIYSQALYTLYYEDYAIQLQAFLDEQEPLDEE